MKYLVNIKKLFWRSTLKAFTSALDIKHIHEKETRTTHWWSFLFPHLLLNGKTGMLTCLYFFLCAVMIDQNDGWRKKFLENGLQIQLYIAKNDFLLSMFFELLLSINDVFIYDRYNISKRYMMINYFIRYFNG